MAEKQFDLLVAGEINPDLVLLGDVVPEFGQVEKLVDSAVLSIGSSSAIFACGAARLGLKVGFIGKCGDDLWGRFMLDEMRKREVNVDHVIVVPGGVTGLSVILSTGPDRAILTNSGLTTALRADEVSDGLLKSSRHLHVASYFLQTDLQPGMPSLFRRARSLGLTTSLDTNYDPSGEWKNFDELLGLTNLFLPNETEARSLTHEKDAEEAARKLISNVDLLGLKLGARGAIGASNSRLITSPSLQVRVVDTVGAGDSFDAGFIYGYLHDWDLQKTLRLACVCGALSTRASGGTTAQPTLEEAMTYA